MSLTTKIQEFQVSEYDVVNLFAYSGANTNGVIATAGTVVTPVSISGWRTADNDLILRGSVGAAYGNTLSQRWGVAALVRDCGTGDAPLGLLRYDIRETDENSTSWKLYPNKWVENKWTISGEASPIITKGFVFYSGIPVGGGTVGAPTTAYASGAGDIVAGQAHGAITQRIGKFWGAKDNSQFALLQVNPQ